MVHLSYFSGNRLYRHVLRRFLECRLRLADSDPDRNTAELFRGKFLRIKREDAEPLEENSYYIADIIGCKVYTETGKFICTVKEVISAKTDVFVGETEDKKTVRFPFLKDALYSVDTAAKTITVKEKRFGEISL